jgi:hypothetical protein
MMNGKALFFLIGFLMKGKKVLNGGSLFPEKSE